MGEPTLFPDWHRAHLDDPAAAAFAAVADGVRLRCPECYGTGFDPPVCPECEGRRTWVAERGTPEWRVALDRQLQAAALDPAYFDDDGRLVDHVAS